MNSVSRGVRNAFRNALRTFSIVTILGLSVGLSMSMLVARQAVQDKIATVKANVGNTISVSPAGARGFEGGGEALTSEQMGKLESLANVTGVLQVLSDRLTTDNTNLQSSIDPGTLGNRAQGNSGINFQTQYRDVSVVESDNSSVQRTFTPPVTVNGVNDLSQTSVYGGDNVTFTSGEVFDATKDENVAILGKAIAEKNGLSVGSTFTAYSETIKVVGIYDTGNTFANNGVIMPLVALQRLSGQTGQITSATVYVDSVDNLDSVTSAVKSTLGDSADVVSSSTTAEASVQPLESVETLTLYSVIAALIAGAMIILLTMTMIVRERRKEIGVMKAIGSSNIKTMMQFTTEAITLVFMGLIIGLAMTYFASQPITDVLVKNSTSSNSSIQGPGGFNRQQPMRLVSISSGSSNFENIKTSIKPDIFLYGVIATFLIAIIGSSFPVYLLSKIRPAEVMRNE